MNKKFRPANILKAAIDLGFEFDDCDSLRAIIEASEEFIRNHAVAERHECDITVSGRTQSVSFGDYRCTGEIIDFSAHWHEAPDTEVEHEMFINNDGQLIQLYYVVGVTDYNQEI